MSFDYFRISSHDDTDKLFGMKHPCFQYEYQDSLASLQIPIDFNQKIEMWTIFFHVTLEAILNQNCKMSTSLVHACTYDSI